jgi:FkbM family methyltransferase
MNAFSFADQLQRARAAGWRAGDADYLSLLPVLAARKQGLAIDIGALEGLYALEMVKHFAHVLAYEPLPEGFAILQKNMADVVAAKKATLRQKALSDASGITDLWIPVCDGKGVGQWASIAKDYAALNREFPGYLQGAAKVTVEMATLDSERAALSSLPPPALVKIDAEGAEEAILRGMADTLRKARPFLIVEMEDRHVPGCTQSIPAFLAAEGYAMFFILMDAFYPVADLDIAEVQQGPRVPTFHKAGVPMSEPYINLFLALPVEETGMMEELAAVLQARVSI